MCGGEGKNGGAPESVGFQIEWRVGGGCLGPDVCHLKYNTPKAAPTVAPRSVSAIIYWGFADDDGELCRPHLLHSHLSTVPSGMCRTKPQLNSEQLISPCRFLFLWISSSSLATLSPLLLRCVQRDLLIIVIDCHLLFRCVRVKDDAGGWRRISVMAFL